MTPAALKAHAERLLAEYAAYDGSAEDFLMYAIYNTAKAVEDSIKN